MKNHLFIMPEFLCKEVKNNSMITFAYKDFEKIQFDGFFVLPGTYRLEPSVLSGGKLAKLE